MSIWYPSVTGLTSFYTELMKGLGASSRIWELSDRNPLIPYKGNNDKKHAKSLSHYLMKAVFPRFYAGNKTQLIHVRASVFTLHVQHIFLKVIRKTCPCNVYPFEPHFYIVKLGFAGVYLFFLFLLQKIDCGFSLEPPQRGGSNVYPQSMF